MKTIKVNLYEFNELSEDAKEFALQKHVENHEMSWLTEYVETIEKCLDYFGFYMRDWGIGVQAHQSYVDIQCVHNENVSNLSGVRLWKYITNNFPEVVNDDFCLTGFCADYTFFRGVREFMLKPDSTMFRELMRNSVEEVLAEIERDYEYQCSEDYFADLCQANEYLFTEDGELWR